MYRTVVYLQVAHEQGGLLDVFLLEYVLVPNAQKRLSLAAMFFVLVLKASWSYEEELSNGSIVAENEFVPLTLEHCLKMW